MTNMKPAAGTPSSEDVKKLEQYKQDLKVRAEALLLQSLPSRIAKLTEMLMSPEFNMEFSQFRVSINIPRPSPVSGHAGGDGSGNSTETSNGSDVESARKRKRTNNDSSDDVPAGSKVILMPNGTVDTNRTLADLVDIVKPLILQQIEDCNLLKMWIELQIPKVEDGNNFGVDIQEDCLKEVSSAEAEAAVYLEKASMYYMARAKMIVKVAKYPHVEDFRKTVEELDEKQYVNLKLIVRELLNNYAAVHDILCKNLEKIKRPRTMNAENLY